MGLYPGTPGSRPGLMAVVNRGATWAALRFIFKNKLQHSTNRSMDKEGVVYIHTQIYANGILLCHENECDLAIQNNMDGPRQCNASQNKSTRGREILYDLTHIWNLRNKTSKGKRRRRPRNRL